MDKPLRIGTEEVLPGQNLTIDLPLAQLYTHTPMTMPVHVIRGRRAGPRLFVCAAIHGDEINGVEIIRRLLSLPLLKKLRGDLIAVPIVNVPGFLQRSRYLPDRRDLNRSFPGSEKGSLAGRVAHLFLNEIVAQCSHGIDLHTAAIDRANLPQVRANLDDPIAAAMAEAFRTPVTLNANLRDGSVRQAGATLGIPMIVYECGEALRFDEHSIRIGLRGIVRVMRHLGMLPAARATRSKQASVVTHTSAWVRASQSGILRAVAPLGASVEKNSILGYISDPFGESETQVISPWRGIVIGRTTLPLAYQGEALYHIARLGRNEMEQLEDAIQEEDPLPAIPYLQDEPVIV
ncbi:succinylglutamate desuccinylase/aspartoacylase family protein [Sedimenticola thiotaurini]|uniref:Succinylglutamate desuccinylase n=1 Tax=Sedimenticola thiotaurini TaxID=1543721 RepID=A0A0F7JYQ0_9GAMM|nr:succinylglutamate desuccinylase/aspartoacylase family protein [Sedimenticola thiotaurini]AKH19783.1 succinylglutamate desuccinylase [Sedimenticola thiotaurini]